jgi:predicted dehydrogenase
LKKLKLATIGCGGRATAYMSIAANLPDQYENVAAADPLPARREALRIVSGNPNLLMFENDREILSRPKLADLMIIATQDSYHKEPCLRAMEAGYDILLEKPIASSLAEVMELNEAAQRMNRRVLVCHVLRYTPFYRMVKKIIDSGELGEVVSVNAREGVGAWHQAHSYVRGHWAVTENCSPMIVAKSCHDMDILYWLIGRECRSVASYGALSFFSPVNRPDGAPDRCTDGCPFGAECMYNALHYLGSQRKWLGLVMDGAATAGDNRIRDWLRVSPWGRCVYACDNTAVDHQVVSMDFEGGVTASFTMTAFDEGRSIEIFGTRGSLYGGAVYKEVCGEDLAVIDHRSGVRRMIRVNYESGGYSGHAGGDAGLVQALHEEMNRPDPAAMCSSIQSSVTSHAMAFAAEHARIHQTVVRLDEFCRQQRHPAGSSSTRGL